MKIVKMKLAIVLIFACTFSVVAQNAEESIRKRFKEQATAMKEKDFAKSIEYTADVIFNLVPKEQMLNMMTMTFNNPQLEFISAVPDIMSIGEVEKVDNQYYVIFEAKGIQKMRVFGPDGTALGPDDPSVSAMQANLEKSFGEGSVKFDEETKFFEVNVQQKYVTISPDGKTGWKFITIDKSLYGILDQLLPLEIAAKVK